MIKFKIGDKVSFDTKNQGIIFGTIINISIGWTPEKFYVRFEGNMTGLNLTTWVRGDELTLVIDKVKVEFT